MNTPVARHFALPVTPQEPEMTAIPVVALAGNPNTGKSTVFNALTGLHQHTGNWPGKTIARAQGTCVHRQRRYHLVDLPGTYSLLSASADEEVAREFILFGNPARTVVVVDATALDRNLNLVLQVMEITPRVVVCVNLMDEARRKGIAIDVDKLARRLGVPVVPTVARRGQGIRQLMEAVASVVEGATVPSPKLPPTSPKMEGAMQSLLPMIQKCFPRLCDPRWIAYRLLEGDRSISTAIESGSFKNVPPQQPPGDFENARRAAGSPSPADIMAPAATARRSIGAGVHDEIVAALYRHADSVARDVVTGSGKRYQVDQRLDGILTHPLWGLPIMLALLAVVLWITVVAANIPSKFLSGLLMEKGGLSHWFDVYVGKPAPASLSTSLYELLHRALVWTPHWFSGVAVDGIYLCVAWVVSVMLPPMAIFFPLFTLLEDLGYLPRVAFNLDWMFKKAGAHGKQALTMCMGLGCNAAGVTACRIINSPRERLIAILTNNFMICNGRFPTVVAVSAVMAAGAVSARWVSFVCAATIVFMVLLGAVFTLAISRLLSRTVLRGEASFFVLELPPYRRPAILRILYTSLIDRTIFVLGRAVSVAAPAGAIIWIVSNIQPGGVPIGTHLVRWLDPVGHLMGLDGVIILAYIVAIPANEIVIPTALMLYLKSHRMVEFDGSNLGGILAANGWTTMTAVCLLLFCLLHNPCATTIWTIWRETHSIKWTLFGACMPLVIGIIVCAAIAMVWRWVT